MGFVRPSGRNHRQTALFGALLASLALAAAPAGAALDDQARAEILHQRGSHALRSGEPEKAIEYLEQALALKPDHAASLALYARALLEAGRAADAERATERLRKLAPGDSDVTFLLAVTAYRQQDWITARRYLEEARGQHPGDARVRLYLGRTYQELGQDTDAQRELEEAARLDPDFQGPAAYRLAILHLQRAETKEAVRYFEEVKRVAPDTELANSAELYLVLIRQGQPKRFSYWVKLGAAYDSNITVAGANDLVEQSAEDGVEGSLEIGLNGKLFDWNGLSMRSGVTNYVSYHNKEHSFDIQQVRPWLLTTYRPLEFVAFDLRLTYEQVWRNYHHFKTAYHAEPAIRLIPKDGWLTKVFFNYEDRNYHDAFEVIPTRDRDGQVRKVGFDQYFPLPNPFADGPAYFRVGYRYRVEAATGHHFDSRSHEPLATLGFALPWEMNVTIDTSWERREFAEASFFEVNREIQTTGAFAGCTFNLPPPLSVPFSQDFSMCNSQPRLDKITQARVRLRKNIGKSWTVESYYRWVDWESNTDEFNFNRHMVGLAATFRR